MERTTATEEFRIGAITRWECPRCFRSVDVMTGDCGDRYAMTLACVFCEQFMEPREVPLSEAVDYGVGPTVAWVGQPEPA